MARRRLTPIKPPKTYSRGRKTGSPAVVPAENTQTYGKNHLAQVPKSTGTTGPTSTPVAGRKKLK